MTIAIVKTAKRFTRFLLAVLLWSHAVFILKIEPPQWSQVGSWLHLQPLEAAAIVLLAAMSFAASYGLGAVVVDLIYIYCFPFVLLFHAGRYFVRGFIFIARWFIAGTADKTQPTSVVPIPPPTITVAPSESRKNNTKQQTTSWYRKLALFCIRPFARFALLWGFLVVVSTHRALIYTALIAVSFQLVRFSVRLVETTLLSNVWLGKVSDIIQKIADAILSKLELDPRSQQPSELKNLWHSLFGLQWGLKHLQNKKLVGRWAMLLGSLYVGAISLYLATLFSFVYSGLCKLLQLDLSWAKLLVLSLFMPLTFSNFPNVTGITLVNGIHALLVVGIGGGTIFRYWRETAEKITRTADSLTSKMTAADVQGKIVIIRTIVERTDVGSQNGAAPKQDTKKLESISSE